MARDESRPLDLLRERFPDDDPADDLGTVFYRHATPLDAFLYLNLFWPDFIEIDGMVFWSEAIGVDDPERIRAALHDVYGNDRAQTEKSFNYVEVPYLFANPDPTGEVDDAMYLELALLLSEMWLARLKALFPGRIFRSELDEEDTSLVFYEERAS